MKQRRMIVQTQNIAVNPCYRGNPLQFMRYNGTIYRSCPNDASVLSFFAMHFSLIDKIESLEPGKQIVAAKNLSLAEEYLQDHFPNFPVMPGVLMLEALTQSSAWLIRCTENFAHSIVVLKEAQNVKYARFVQPGQTLIITATLVKEEGNLVRFKAEGTVEGQTNLKANLVLCRSNLADTAPGAAEQDRKIIKELKERFKLLYRK